VSCWKSYRQILFLTKQHNYVKFSLWLAQLHCLCKFISRTNSTAIFFIWKLYVLFYLYVSLHFLCKNFTQNCFFSVDYSKYSVLVCCFCLQRFLIANSFEIRNIYQFTIFLLLYFNIYYM
jgi:hypothetical protein